MRKTDRGSVKKEREGERVEGMKNRLRVKMSKPPGLKYNDITGELV